MDDEWDYSGSDSSDDDVASSEAGEAKATGDHQPAAASSTEERAQEFGDEEFAEVDDAETDEAGGDDGAETYVPQSAVEDDGATYAPQFVDDDGFTVERQTAAAGPEEEQPADERECAVDELAAMASICLKFPSRFGELRGRLEERITRRIAMQTGQKTRRMFGRWLRDFADRACATYGPEELLYLCTISTRHDHPGWSTAMWQQDADELRDAEGRLHEWAEYADD